jgi:phage terminase Nu1 subunit (DNA packaging protein)
VVDRLIDVELDNRLLFNQKTTALLLAISTQALSKWDVQPQERRGREVFYYWPDVHAEFLRRNFPPRVAGDDDGEPVFLNLDQERARLAKEQADKLEMENAIQRGEIAYLPDVAKQQGRVFQMIRTKALGLPTKCAPHANPENPNIARDIIEREVLELLGEVAAADLSEEFVECGADGGRRALPDEPPANGNGATTPRKTSHRRNGAKHAAAR